jgi:hypothetical protein
MVERDGNVRKRMVAREGKNGRNIWVGIKKKKKKQWKCQKMEVVNGCKYCSISGMFLSNCSLGF